MLLRYLELTNFMTHEHEEIRFPEEGMFLLAGDSGSGKSSMIVDGVGYALFGYKATRARKQSDLLNEDAPGEMMKVKAIFDFSEDERLIIERGYDSKGHSFAKAFTPDPADPSSSILLAESATPVGKLLAKRLGGMSWQQFNAAFVARQSEIALLTTLKGADRKNLIHRMLGMKELEKAGELITSKTKRARTEVDQLQRSIGGGFDLREAREKIEEARRRLTDEQARVISAEEALDVSREELAEVDAQLEPLAESVSEARALETKRVQLSAGEQEIGHLEERARRSREAEGVVAREEEVSGLHRAAEAALEAFKDIYRRSKKSDSIRQRLAALEERRSELRLKVSPPVPVLASGSAEPSEDSWEGAEEARSRREVLRSQRKTREVEIAEREEQLARLRESGECYACQRPFESSHDHEEVMSGLESSLRELRDSQVADASEIEEIAAALPVLEEIEKLEEEVRGLGRELSELAEEGETREDLGPLTEEGKKAREDVEVLGRKLAEISAAKKELDPEATEKLDSARAALETLRAEVEGAASAAADEEAVSRFEELGRRSRELSSQVAAADARLPELRRAAEAAELELTNLEREIEGREAEMKALERLRRKQLVAENVGSYMRAYQRQLANEIRPALTEIGSEMLSQISNGRHVAMHIDEDYEISVETSKGAIKKASMLSGGEEIRANICLRLALTRLVSQRTGVPVGFLVFDEPLPSQDAGHVERILELLESLRPFYRQQFLISHVGELRSADEMDYVLEFQAGDGPDRVQMVNA